MNRWKRALVLPLAALAPFVGAHAAVLSSQETQAQSEVKMSWEAQIAKAESVKRGTRGEPDVPRNGILLKLDVSFRYVGADAEVQAPLIEVRDATGQEWSMLSDTKGGRDKDCIVWLSMSPFIKIGLRPPTLPRAKVESCRDSVLSYYFALPSSAKPPFNLLFADAAPIIVTLN